MVYQSAAEQGAQYTFVIRPNRSMSWRTLVWVYAGIAAVIAAVGIVCFFAGLPLVLPFSGLEMIVLGVAFYMNAWHGGEREVITIAPDAVAVEAGREQPEARQEFQRHWTRVVLQEPGIGWYPSRLLIRSHGREVEVGRFLNEQERRGLALELRAALGRKFDTRAWQA